MFETNITQFSGMLSIVFFPIPVATRCANSSPRSHACIIGALRDWRRRRVGMRDRTIAIYANVIAGGYTLIRVTITQE